MPDNERHDVPAVTNTNTNLVTLVMSWASGQPFNNVMLMAIFSALCWITYFAVTVAIPEHLKHIQEGYEKLEKGNMEERQETIEVYDKWFERMERYHDDNTRGKEKSSGSGSAVIRPSLQHDMESMLSDQLQVKK